MVRVRRRMATRVCSKVVGGRRVWRRRRRGGRERGRMRGVRGRVNWRMREAWRVKKRVYVERV